MKKLAILFSLLILVGCKENSQKSDTAITNISRKTDTISKFKIDNVSNFQDTEYIRSSNFFVSKIDSTNYQEQDTVYLINKETNKKITFFEVSPETYEGADIYELTENNLENTEKIFSVDIVHCACYCDSEYTLFIINKNKDIIKLPTINQEDFELNKTIIEYKFPKSEKNIFYLVKEKYTYKDSLKEAQKISSKILKKYSWDGKKITVL